MMPDGERAAQATAGGGVSARRLGTVMEGAGSPHLVLTSCWKGSTHLKLMVTPSNEPRPSSPAYPTNLYRRAKFTLASLERRAMWGPVPRPAHRHHQAHHLHAHRTGTGP